MTPYTDIFIFKQVSLPILIVTAVDSAADKSKKDFEVSGCCGAYFT